MELLSPQSLELLRYERVWWDPVHQHFVVIYNGLFYSLSADESGVFSKTSTPFPIREVFYVLKFIELLQGHKTGNTGRAVMGNWPNIL